jgi:antibiotic biosynthesis monooxygenase (ABM) superfamily enzyme
MVIHTFFFRWKAGVTDAQKQRAQDEICALHTQIPGILETNVGVNFSPRSLGYEFAGVMKFTDRATLEAYSTHPVHLQLLSWLVPLIDPIEVDFEA